MTQLIEGLRTVLLECRTCGELAQLAAVDMTMESERVVVARTMEQLIKDSGGIQEGMEPGSALEAINHTTTIVVVGFPERCRCRGAG